MPWCVIDPECLGDFLPSDSRKIRRANHNTEETGVVEHHQLGMEDTTTRALLGLIRQRHMSKELRVGLALVSKAIIDSVGVSPLIESLGCRETSDIGTFELLCPLAAIV